MSVKYVVYQNNNEKNPKKGWWYGRVKYQGTINERKMAEEIEKRSTVHLADILAVIASLKEVMAEHIMNSERVVLTDFGTFKLGMTTKAAETRDDFTTANIVSSRVIFQEAKTLNTNRTVSTRSMSTGVKFEELDHYEGNVKKTSTSKGTSSDSGTTSDTGGSTGSGGSSDSGSSSSGGSSDSGSSSSGGSSDSGGANL